MPSSSDELRDIMGEYFGDRYDEYGPMKFLEDAGYKLTRDWRWDPKPGVKFYEDMTHKEWECLSFLIEEWDFGGLIEEGE